MVLISANYYAEMHSFGVAKEIKWTWYLRKLVIIRLSSSFI